MGKAMARASEVGGLDGEEETGIVSVAEAELALVSTASGCLAFHFLTIFFFLTVFKRGVVGEAVARAGEVAGLEDEEETGIVSVVEVELLLVGTATGCLAFFFSTSIIFSTVEFSVADGSASDSHAGTGSASRTVNAAVAAAAIFFLLAYCLDQPCPLRRLRRLVH